MTVPTCSGCKHAQQVHTPADGSLCRGLCAKYGHSDLDHTGPCTARCTCERFHLRP